MKVYTTLCIIKVHLIFYEKDHNLCIFAKSKVKRKHKFNYESKVPVVDQVTKNGSKVLIIGLKYQ